MSQWMYVFKPSDRPELARGEGWTADDEAVAADHVAYLGAAAEQGTVILAGRCQDGIGPAIVIIEAPDDDAARAFMEGDPFVSNGLFGADLHPYRVAFWSPPTDPSTSP